VAAVTGDVRRSLGEWAVLGLVSEGPAHPFALGRHLAPSGSLGRVLTVRRPLVYRAIGRLEDAGLVAPKRIEPGDAGPERTVYGITPAGRRALDRWLQEPVAHIRDLRLGLLLKLALLRRSGRPIGALVAAQQEALTATFSALDDLPDDPDDADRWRRHTARAAAAFLDEVADHE
jgi:PadR family transcriptional regulator AphA